MEDIETRITALEGRIAKLEAVLMAPVTRIDKTKPMSPKEFLKTKKASADTQKVLALGYFLEHHSDMSSFSVSDLEIIFRQAKEKLPKNINDTVNKNIKRGFLDEAREKKNSKKAWYLTSTGEQYVERELSNKV
jgi:hypothetical protein